jgi:hypothetical protein
LFETFDCDTINRFPTFARALDPASRPGTFGRPGAYGEIEKKPPKR